MPIETVDDQPGNTEFDVTRSYEAGTSEADFIPVSPNADPQDVEGTRQAVSDGTHSLVDEFVTEGPVTEDSQQGNANFDVTSSSVAATDGAWDDLADPPRESSGTRGKKFGIAAVVVLLVAGIFAVLKFAAGNATGYTSPTPLPTSRVDVSNLEVTVGTPVPTVRNDAATSSGTQGALQPTRVRARSNAPNPATPGSHGSITGVVTNATGTSSASGSDNGGRSHGHTTSDSSSTNAQPSPKHN